MKTSRLLLLIIAIGLSAFVACTNDTYESGDGDNSYLCADFAIVNVDTEGRLVSFLTDENHQYSIETPLAVEGIKGDTVYRALVYYDNKETSTVALRGLTWVGVCKPFLRDTVKVMKTDPVGWESMWMSQNASYLNLALNLKIGENGDDAAHQRIGIAKSLAIRNHHYLELYHDQNGVPEYYTQTTYVSIPMTDRFKSGDSITVTVNTYDGTVRKSIRVE